MKMKVVKINDEIIYGAEDPTFELIDIKKNGEPVLLEKKILPGTKSDLIKVVSDTVLSLSRKRIHQVLSQYSYNSLGDVQLYASQNDPEAQAILNWYTNTNGNGYDDLLWNYIDSLPNKTKPEILNDLQDLIAVEENIFQQAVQNNQLP